MAPVKAPLVMEFHGSSFFLIYTNEQSIAENKPPQTAKLPVLKWKKLFGEHFTVNHSVKIKVFLIPLHSTGVPKDNVPKI